MKFSMEGIFIRKAGVQDTPVVVSLIIELLKDFNEKSGSDFSVDKDGLNLVTSKLINRDNFAAFIAYDNAENPVGLITIAEAFAIYNGGEFGVITELYVDRNIRSQGIGKLLLNAAYEFAGGKNWKKVEVGAPNREVWPRSIEFYKRNGFAEKGPKLRIEI